MPTRSMAHVPMTAGRSIRGMIWRRSVAPCGGRLSPGPSAGNAGGALATYAARAGLEAFVFMPEDVPLINRIECEIAGARTYLVRGLITDCGRLVRANAERMGWFDMSTLREPYRVEGKKTL